MTAKTPCESSPDDWFIERDGKQYRDDILVDFNDVDLVELDLQGPGAAQEFIDRAEAEARKQALIRRRKAREACHNDCPVRLQCLDAGLAKYDDDGELHGIWGGYFAEDVIRIGLARQRRRAARGVD